MVLGSPGHVRSRAGNMIAEFVSGTMRQQGGVKKGVADAFTGGRLGLRLCW